MSSEDFDAGDLYGLEVCLRDLEAMLVRHNEAKDDKAVRYALIKTFELTYEMAIKTLRKYLIAYSPRSGEVATFNFNDLIRLGDQEELLLTGLPAWNQYRQNRGRTVHTYGDAVALQITAQLAPFAHEAQVLLRNLKEKVESNHG